MVKVRCEDSVMGEEVKELVLVPLEISGVPKDGVGLGRDILSEVNSVLVTSVVEALDTREETVFPSVTELESLELLVSLSPEV